MRVMFDTKKHVKLVSKVNRSSKDIDLESGFLILEFESRKQAKEMVDKAGFLEYNGFCFNAISCLEMRRVDETLSEATNNFNVKEPTNYFYIQDVRVGIERLELPLIGRTICDEKQKALEKELARQLGEEDEDDVCRTQKRAEVMKRRN